MNKDYPPFPLISPEIVQRRPEIRPIPYPIETLQRRQEISAALLNQITPLSDELRQLSDEERKAIFFKLEHEVGIDLVGTDLKRVAQLNETTTLVIPKSSNLDKLAGKIEGFSNGEIRQGHVKNERLAIPLKQIEKGEPKDRLSPFLIENYNKLVKQAWVICEVEIFTFASGRNQQIIEIQNILTALVRAFSNGIHGTLFEQETVHRTVRAVIRCTGQLFKKLVEDDFWQTKIWYFEERPEFETFTSVLRDFNVTNLGKILSPDDSAPTVCIVDSGITIGNPFLRPVTDNSLLHSFLREAPDNPSDEHGHGSAVASLAAYYTLGIATGDTNQGKVWIASARVLNRENRAEEDEDTHPRLFSKILSDVVAKFAPMGVKVFNLSVNILNRHWNNDTRRTFPRSSWVARTLDRLSREYDIIFVVSTGNILPPQVRSFIEDNKPYPSYFVESDAAIFDPAQAALALTVGSIAPSTLVVGPLTASALAEINQPSPFTRSGPDVCREIKPELVEFGGNYLIDEGGQVRANPGTNVVVASNKITPAIANNSGTSFAAPRVAHKLALILADLQNSGVENVSAPMLKAFAVNSASYLDHDHFIDTLDQVRHKHWRNVLGYGFPDNNHATNCDPYSAILFFQGTLMPNKVAFFGIPVPPDLADAENGVKRLSITVSYAPEIQRWGLERYLGTSLKWRAFRGNIDRDEIISAMSIESEDADPPPIPNEIPNPKIGISLRSRGTTQHDIYEWSAHQREYSANFYTLAIAAYEKWGRPNPDPVPYAIVVRLEDTTRTCNIYTEIQNIYARVEVRT